LLLPQVWTAGLCGVISRELGFTSTWRDYPFLDVRQLMNLRLFVKVEPELCGELPGFSELSIPAGCRTWNQQVIKMRARLDPELFVCPKEYPEEHVCHLCPIGEDQCPMAVHPQTFDRGPCDRCQKDDTWFDTLTTHKVCVDCLSDLRRKGER
jgi:hypothetical protein